jgi:hypothetical protein
MRPILPEASISRFAFRGFAACSGIAFLLLLSSCGGGGGDTDPCSSCLEHQLCDEETGVCVEPGLTGLEGTDLAPGIAGTWDDGEANVLVFDRIGSRFLFGAGHSDGEEWQTAALADEPFPPPHRPRMAKVGSSDAPAFLAETAPGQLSLLGRTEGVWTRQPAGEFAGPLSDLAAASDSGLGFHACAGDVDRGLWYAGSGNGPLQWEPVAGNLPEGLPSTPCAVGVAGGQPLVLAALRPAGLASFWRDQDKAWQHAVIDADAVPLALAVAPSENGLVTAWVDGLTGELRVAGGQGGQIDVTTPAAVSPELAASCAVGLAASPSGLVRLAFRDAGAGQLLLFGPQPSGMGWEPLASASQAAPLAFVLGFDSQGIVAEAVGVESASGSGPGPGIFKAIEFSQTIPN